MIEEIERIVREACAAETNIYGYGIWTHHVNRVVAWAKRLAPLLGADPQIVEVAALLHDYAAIKDASLTEEHHLHGAVEAERILSRLGYPPERIEAVKHCIVAHRGSVALEKETPEAECVASADAATHIEQVPSLLHMVFVREGMGIDEGTRWVRGKLERSWRKLSPPVQEMLRQQYEAALRVLGGRANEDSTAETQRAQSYAERD